MRKALIAIVVLVFVFTGCASNNNNEYSLVNEKTPDSTQNTEGGETGAPTVKPVAGKDQSGLQQISMLNNSRGCSTESGYYEIDQVFEPDYMRSNILYTDFDTKEQKYLCSDPTCNHKVDECVCNVSALVGNSEGVLFTDNEYLYILVRSFAAGDMIPAAAAEGEDDEYDINNTAIYRMKLDGSKAEKVYEFEQWETVDETVFYDGKNLIMLEKKIVCKPVDEMNVSLEAESAEMIQLSLKDFTRTSVMNLDPEVKAVGCTSNTLVLVKEDYPKVVLKPGESIPSGSFKDPKIDAVVSVYNIDLSSKDPTPIKTINDTGLKTYAVTEDSFYYGVAKAGVIKQINLKDGKESTFAETKYDNIIGLADEYLICQSGMGTVNDPTTLLSLQDGKATDMAPQLNYSASISPIASNSKYYLVERNYDELNSKPIYALIAKSKYYQQVDEYEDIKSVERTN